VAKAKKIWEVEYQERSRGGVSEDDWMDGECKLWVLANDGEAAMAAVRKRRVNRKWDWEDDNGKKHTESVSAVRVKSIACVGEIDLVA